MTESIRGSWFVRADRPLWTGAPAPAEVRRFHAGLPGYAPTPLVELPALAAELGVGRVFVKDESHRLGLPAFKALGASWAVHRVLSSQTPGTEVRLVTATDGNHGRAVARMARLFGHQAHIFVPRGVHPTAIAAISAEQAEVTPVDGDYDEAVRRAADAARAPGSVLVQDTAWPGYEEIPGWIVEGYSTLFEETDDQLRAAGVESPDLLAVPVGVGSLAQAAVTHYRSRPGNPTLLSVEPDSAACVLESLRQGRPVTVETGTTTMAGLNCGTPSALAWPILRDGLDAAVAITDRDSADAARTLAHLGVSSGPCGAAALAGLRNTLAHTDRRTALNIAPTATVVLLSTEGAEANPNTVDSEA
ncbi:pyridoxal-phosphate dependent enzyme [Streptoalloteichus hindustanus]|uniref:Diaminopropionate ammonia-lyase n=1 Tax=Streptoalloteichus hindustanus TaxID=2017 RepID=A0A1M5CJX7_STRHI|nr:pyridoxal-phosphate dependent enzyme [Streptoalloteichus hindustanus]SHF55009.1 diaminopropionate ammonia-lyase [Streptoalloteichus hindustanus]